ncbi:hypothetical protein [Halomontanus rarus]|uniref:hypothetical protein n=1 Tax=Halomontanus rarus TaxID=3034020 RepID=UPI0023E7F579|nr:hypothetical protein [Halovivax sp. TS33]
MKRTIIVLGLALMLVLAGCGGPGDAPNNSSGEEPAGGEDPAAEDGAAGENDTAGALSSGPTVSTIVSGLH